MAKFSAAEAAKRKSERFLPIIQERADLFKKFRDADWEVNAVVPVAQDGPFTFQILPDAVEQADVNYRVKMPGAYPVLARSIRQLYIFAKGIK